MSLYVEKTWIGEANPLGPPADTDPGDNTPLDAAALNDFEDRIAAGFEVVEDFGQVVQRDQDTTLAASTWVPVFVAPVACIVRNVILLPRANTATNSTDYWNLEVAASRAVNGNPTGDPPATGVDLIATRPVNGGVNNFAINVPWDFGTVLWDEPNTHLLPRDVVGIYATKVGAPAALPAMLLTARITPETVT